MTTSERMIKEFVAGEKIPASAIFMHMKERVRIENKGNCELRKRVEEVVFYYEVPYENHVKTAKEHYPEAGC